jgi:hypothetical protein
MASALHAFIALLASGLSGLAAWLLRGCAGVLAGASDQRMIVAAAAPTMHRLMVVAPLLVLTVFCFAAVTSLVRGNAPSVARLGLLGVPSVVAALVFAIPLAVVVIRLGDGLTALVASPVTQAGHVGLVLNTLSINGPAPAAVLFGLVAVVVTFFLWCELIVRSVALAVLLAVTPLLVPLSLVPSWRRVTTRLAETFFFIVMAKVLVALVLAVGISFVHGHGASSLVAGVVTMGLATLAPLLLLRLIPLFEDAAVHAVGGLRGHVMRGVGALQHSPLRPVAERFLPEAPLIGPPETPEDFDIPMAEGVPIADEDLLPKWSGEKLPPPIERNKWARPRRGHAVVLRDELGPVIGWHWDD